MSELVSLTPHLDNLLGTDWQGLSTRDKRTLLARLQHLEATTRPEDDLAEQRRALRDGGPVALHALLAAGDDDLEDSSPLHEHLGDWHLAEADRPSGARHAVAAARGHGKTTVGCEVGAVWHAAHLTRRFIVIVSATHAQARDRIAAITAYLTETPELLRLYPGLAPGVDARGQLIGWRDDDITLANGVRIVGKGAGAKGLRGLKQGSVRPDLLILDDLESEQSVATEDALAKMLRWLSRVALPLGSATRPTSVLWVGSILTRAALLNLATGSALDEGQTRPDWARSWTRGIFPAEVRGTDRVPVTVTVEDPDTGAGYERTVDVGEPMWSAMTREALAAVKIADPAAYAAEYLADPADTGQQMLAHPRVARWANPTAPPAARVAILDDGRLVPVALMTRAAALDPQYAKPRTSKVGSDTTTSSDPDLAAVAVVGQWQADTFLLDAWIGRDRHGQAGRLVAMATAWGCWAARVETNGAQVLTADAAAALSTIPIISKASTGGKVERALGLAARLGDPEHPGTGRVHVLPDAEHGTGKGGKDYGGLTQYLTAFPGGRFDDPVDAVVMALELAVRGAGSQREDAASVPVVAGSRQAPPAR